jgi:nucleoside-diphosphate-sugar epimerase
VAGRPGARDISSAAFDGYVADNLVATQRVLEACLARGITRVVYSSSSSVYGSAPTGPIHEDTKTEPISIYGLSKLAAEKLCLQYSRLFANRISVTCLRYFTAYGPRQRDDMLVQRVIMSALLRKPLEVLGDGAHARDFTFVGDVVAANVLAMRAEVGPAVMNIGAGQPHTVRDVVETVEEATGLEVPIQHLPPSVLDPLRTHADTSRARRLLGFRPETGLAKGIAAQVEWNIARLDQ